MYLLRIKKRKWDRLDLSWLQTDEVHSDPITDLDTEEGVLSVWEIDDDGSNLSLVIAALASNRDKLAKFEYGLFDEQYPKKLNINVEVTEGGTSVQEANRYHRDLTKLTIQKLALLVGDVFTSIEKFRLDKDEVQDEIVESVKQNRIDINRLRSQKLKSEIESALS